MAAVASSPSIGNVTFDFFKDQPGKVIKWCRTGLDWTKFANNGLSTDGQKARDVFNITYNMLSLPEIPGNLKNIGAGAVNLTSVSTPSEFVWTAGKIMSDSTSLVSNVADVAGIFDKHVTPITSKIMGPLNNASIVGLGLGSTYHVLKFGKDIYDLQEKVACDPEDNNEYDINDDQIEEFVERARSSQVELLYWKIAEKVAYVALAALLCLSAFAAVGVPVAVILTLQTATLVFGTVKYFYDEMVTKPANEGVVFKDPVL